MAAPVAKCRFCGLCLSSADSHDDLCANLRKNGLLSTDTAYGAFSRVDRGDFVPDVQWAYEDAAVPIGAGAQISAPHVHASALDLLCERLPSIGAEVVRVLDIGSGSGYMCTLLAHVVRGVGRVTAIEHMEELAASSRQHVAQRHGDLLAPGGNLEILCEDALRLAERPDLAERFDLVHCGAALERVPPWLLRLLRPGGRAVVPLGPTDAPQRLSAVDKALDGSVSQSEHIRVLYVPVTTAAAQRERERRWGEVVDSCVRNSSDSALEGDDLYS